MEKLLVTIVDRLTFKVKDKAYCYNYTMVNDFASSESSTFVLDLTDEQVSYYQELNYLQKNTLVIIDYPPSPFTSYASLLYLGVIRSYDNDRTIEVNHFYSLFDVEIPLQNSNVNLKFTPRMVKEWMQLCLHGVLYQISSYNATTNTAVWKFPYNAKYEPINGDMTDLEVQYSNKYFNILGEDKVNKLEQYYNFQINSLSLSNLVDKIKQGLEDYHNIVNVEINDLLLNIQKRIDSIDGYLVSTPTLLTPSIIESFEDTDYETFYNTYYEIHDISSSNHAEEITFNYGKQTDADVVADETVYVEKDNPISILDKIKDTYTNTKAIYPFIVYFDPGDLYNLDQDFNGVIIDLPEYSSDDFYGKLYDQLHNLLYFTRYLKISSNESASLHDRYYETCINVHIDSTTKDYQLYFNKAIPFVNTLYYSCISNIYYPYSISIYNKYANYMYSSTVNSNNPTYMLSGKSYGFSIITNKDDLDNLLKYINIYKLYMPKYIENYAIESTYNNGLMDSHTLLNQLSILDFLFPKFDPWYIRFCIDPIYNILYVEDTPSFIKSNIQYIPAFLGSLYDDKFQNIDYNKPNQFNGFTNINDVTYDAIDQHLIDNFNSMFHFQANASFTIDDFKSYFRNYSYNIFINSIVKAIKYYFNIFNISSLTGTAYSKTFSTNTSPYPYLKIYYYNTLTWKPLLYNFDVDKFINSLDVQGPSLHNTNSITNPINKTNINKYVFELENLKIDTHSILYKDEDTINYKINMWALLFSTLNEDNLPTGNFFKSKFDIISNASTKNHLNYLFTIVNNELFENWVSKNVNNIRLRIYLPVIGNVDIRYRYRLIGNYKIYEKDGTTQFYISDTWSFIKQIDVDAETDSYNACFFYTSAAALNNATTLSRVYLCLDHNDLDDLGNPKKKLFQVDTSTPASADLSIPPTTGGFPDGYEITLPLKVKHCILSPTGSNTTSTRLEEMDQAQVELSSTNDSDLEITVEMYHNDEYELIDLRPGMWGNIFANGVLYEDILCTSAEHDTSKNYSIFKFGAKRNTVYSITQQYDKKGKLKK